MRPVRRRKELLVLELVPLVRGQLRELPLRESVGVSVRIGHTTVVSECTLGAHADAKHCPAPCGDSYPAPQSSQLPLDVASHVPSSLFTPWPSGHCCAAHAALCVVTSLYCGYGQLTQCDVALS